MPVGSARLTTGLAVWVATLAVPPAVSVSGPPPDHPTVLLRMQRSLGTFAVLLSLAGEENVTMADDRHYPSENILIHEFSHSCMEVVARRPLSNTDCLPVWPWLGRCWTLLTILEQAKSHCQLLRLLLMLCRSAWRSSSASLSLLLMRGQSNLG